MRIRRRFFDRVLVPEPAGRRRSFGTRICSGNADGMILPAEMV